MRAGTLSFACGVMLLATSSAWGQTDSNLMTSEPCRAVANANLESLEKRKLDLEQTIAVTRNEAEALASKTETARAPDGAARMQDELKRQQNLLIDVLYEMECFRNDLQRTPEITRGQGSVVEITTFYATNRRQTGRHELSTFYSADDTRELAYGRTSVSIPSAHRIGALELPSLWKLELNPDVNRHFVLKSITPLVSADAKRQIVTALTTSRAKSLLIFIHGYNVSFSDAALRTAQLAHDLRFPGLAMFYSWPSAGETSGYLHDEESAQLARGPFDQLLDDLSQLGFEQIYLIAHSMGNRVVGATLAHRVQENKDVSKIQEILLAAPDINVEIFKTEIAPRLLMMQSARKTIYASSKDLALKASKIMHGFFRVGETTGGIFISPGFDTIDASGAAPLVRAFGHSYVLDSASVLNDVEDIVVWHRLIEERTLKQLGAPPTVHWGLR